MNVLVTGGAGYIGSHAALRLLEEGHAVTVLDDLSRGHRAALEILARPGGDFTFIEGDLADAPLVTSALRERSIDAVMHFAALAYVGESVTRPLAYYRSNAAGTLALLESMTRAGVERLVFSSSCATYGEPGPDENPIGESCPQRPVSPYGRSKLHAEQMTADHAAARALEGGAFACALLRYFNVAGCDARARLGEDHRPETHLIPICLEAALGRRDAVTIFGTDYPTPDGTCIRDYVHVDDLVAAHAAALEALRPGDVRMYNVGIGRGRSVREVVDACRRVTGVDFPVAAGERRPGDPPALHADASRIRAELGWAPQVTELEAIVESAWRWRRDHPSGYPDTPAKA